MVLGLSKLYKMEYNISKSKIVTSLFALVLLSSLVSAVGVTAFYWDGDNSRPLYLQPGESKDIYFELQNMVGTDDAAFKVNVIQGSEFVKILDSKEIYEVPAQTKDVKVNVRVTMPNSAAIGEKHKIGFSFTAVNPSASGFSLGSAFDKYFDIVVPSEKPVVEMKEKPSQNMTYLYILIGIIVLGIIIWFVRKKDN